MRFFTVFFRRVLPKQPVGFGVLPGCLKSWTLLSLHWSLCWSSSLDIMGQMQPVRQRATTLSTTLLTPQQSTLLFIDVSFQQSSAKCKPGCFLGVGFDSWGCRAQGGGQARVGLECLTALVYQDYAYVRLIHTKKKQKKTAPFSHLLLWVYRENHENTEKNARSWWRMKMTNGTCIWLVESTVKATFNTPCELLGEGGKSEVLYES